MLPYLPVLLPVSALYGVKVQKYVICTVSVNSQTAHLVQIIACGCAKTT